MIHPALQKWRSDLPPKYKKDWPGKRIRVHEPTEEVYVDFKRKTVPAFTPEIEKRLEEDLAVGRKAEDLARKWAAEGFDCARVIGQMQTLRTFADFSTAGYIRLFQQVKETKAYRHLSVPLPDGTTRTINTFEEFCELMGTSRRKVDEDLQNAAAFGEAFLESAKTAGLGYRDLRALRAASEDVQEEAKRLSDDPEALKVLIDEQGAQNTKLRKSLQEKDKTLEAREKLLAEKNKALDEAREKIVKLESLPPDEEFAQRVKSEAKAVQNLDLKCAELLGMLGEVLSMAIPLLESESPQIALYPHERISHLCREMSLTIREANINADFADILTGNDWRNADQTDQG